MDPRLRTCALTEAFYGIDDYRNLNWVKRSKVRSSGKRTRLKIERSWVRISNMVKYARDKSFAWKKLLDKYNVRKKSTSLAELLGINQMVILRQGASRALRAYKSYLDCFWFKTKKIVCFLFWLTDFGIVHKWCHDFETAVKWPTRVDSKIVGVVDAGSLSEIMYECLTVRICISIRFSC